jgi:hypothetical protein
MVREEPDSETDELTEGEGDDREVASMRERLWQIQCKREKSISPSKITQYVQDMIPKGSVVPYGVIFAAPADFSKKTRDSFREHLRKKGVSELYLWGKADLEDMLFQPKNDHLLYAYFGISLQIQRRSQRRNLRGILAIKRKAIKHLGSIDSNSFKEILVRDIEDDCYPYSKGVSNFRDHPAWKKYFFVGHEHNGIQILIRRFFAYRDLDYEPDGVPKLKAWDFTEKGNFKPKDVWNDDPEEKDHYRVYEFWNKIDERKRAYFEVVGLIKYESIVDIDPEGDIYERCPHVYVRKVNENSFCESSCQKLTAPNRWGQDVYLPANADTVRIKIFPDEFRAPKSTQEDPAPGSEASPDHEKQKGEE